MCNSFMHGNKLFDYHFQAITSIHQQKIALELGKPATAFVEPFSNGGFESGDCFGISWHSPAAELPLCGHGTMAAAAVIFEKFDNRKRVTFETRSGVSLAAAPYGEDRIELRLPALTPSQGYAQSMKMSR